MDFKQVIEGIYADYPALAGRTFILDVENGKIFGAAGVLQKRPALAEAVGELQSQKSKAGHSAAMKFVDDDNAEFNVIAFNHATTSLLSGKAAHSMVDMQACWLLDHEIGHIVVKGGFETGPTVRDEASADAYAMIRHIQRFGTDTGFLEWASWQRANDAVYGLNFRRMTSNVIDQIIEDSKNIDFKKLSPQQTAEMARKYADSALPARQIKASIKEMNGVVLSLIGRYVSPGWYARKIAQSCLATSDKFTFEIGLRIFKPFLSAEGANINGKTISFSDEKRAQYKHALRAHADKIGCRDIFNKIAERQESTPPPAPVPRNRLRTPAEMAQR